jgi:HEXXH motif-containing protein
LWASVNSAVGLAQSIVHEMAHHKLRALGVSFESASAVVANDTMSRYRSPLVGWNRPMAAVLHAHYALLHVAALDVALLGSEHSRTVRAALSRSLVRHVELMRQSASVIRRHMIVDAFGVSYMQAMWGWMGKVLEAAMHYGR